ncbi:hypothetical protein CI102_7487 [Trichoderma harzianum]|nr:hypothetical protein CI102_7487 [Trichoderma harzianum]
MAGPLLASLNELSKLHPAREGGEPPLARAVLRHGDACECLSVGTLFPFPSHFSFLFFFLRLFGIMLARARSLLVQREWGNKNKSRKLDWCFAFLIAATLDGRCPPICMSALIASWVINQMSHPSFALVPKPRNGNDTGLRRHSGCIPGSAILVLQSLATSITTPYSLRQLFESGGVMSTAVGMGSIALSTGFSASKCEPCRCFCEWNSQGAAFWPLGRLRAQPSDVLG